STVRWCNSAVKRVCLSSFAVLRTRSSPVSSVCSLCVDPVWDFTCSPCSGPFPPPVPQLSPRSPLHRYYGPVRLLRRVHVRLSGFALPEPVCSFRHDKGLPVPNRKFLSVLGVFDYAGPLHRSRFSAMPTFRLPFRFTRSASGRNFSKLDIP